MNFLSGQILCFDKPYGMTSFQLVAKVRLLLTRRMEGRKIKVGHAGTLDPLATGVMIICTGRATKLIEQLQGGTKTYETTLKLGGTTPSFDLEHPVDRTFPTDHITEEEIRRVLSEQFTGDIMQVPPVFSACKVDGKRAYDLARKGKQPELQAKPLRIDSIELTRCDLEKAEIDLCICCSKGTYIRALARDIGIALRSGAHLTALRRTRVGEADICRCFATIDDFEQWLGGIEVETELPANPEERASIGVYPE
ncbi:MAG: tRNA pseudouridine(55) synthase TruB [Alloprevotella sp.]